MRTVRESFEYASQRKELQLDVRRLDDVQESIIWGVSRSAEKFDLQHGTDLRVISTDEFPGIPALRVFFRIADQDYVDLIHLELAPEDPDEPMG